MSEMSNALIPYTETRRDRLERKLAKDANKRELDARFSNPYLIIAYYLLKESVCTIYIEDTSLNVSVEYTVPNNEVMEHFNHALAYPEANFPTPWDGK